MSPSRPATPVDNLVVQGLPANLTQQQPPVSTAIVLRPDIADALTWHPHAADTSAVYSCHGTSMSTLQPPYMFSAMKEPTVYRPGLQYTQPQPSAPSDPGYTQHQSDTLSRLPVTTVSDPVHTHMPVHTFPRSLEPACTQSIVTSALPRKPTAPGDFAYDTMQRPADRVDSRNV